METIRNNRKTYGIIFISILMLFVVFCLASKIDVSAATTGTIKASTLFVRTGPSTSHSKVTVNGEAVFLSKGDSISISYEENGWYYVTANFKGTKVTGFVSAVYVDAIGAIPTAAPTATPRPTIGQRPTTVPSSTSNQVVKDGFPREGTVTASTLNVRNTAGVTGTIIGNVGKGTTVKLQSVKLVSGEYWYQISYAQDGVTRTGYVSSEYIKVAVVATPTPVPDMVNGVLLKGFPRTATTKASTLNVRDNIGTTSNVIAQLSKQDAIIVLDCMKDTNGTYWYKINFYQDGESKTGYVSSNYVIIADPTATPQPTATPTPAIDSVVDVVKKNVFPREGTVIANKLYVRNDAGTSYKAVTTIDRNTSVSILGAKKDVNGEYWYQISFTTNGVKQVGYVHSDYVAVEALTGTTPVATATPTPTLPVTPTPVPTVIPTATPTIALTPTLSGEIVTKEEIAGDYVNYYYLASVREDEISVYVEPMAEAQVLTTVKKNYPVVVTSQVTNDTTIWYTVALKINGEIIYGYVPSIGVSLLLEEPVEAQLIQKNIRLRTRAATSASYVKTESGKILILSVGNHVSVLSETIVNNEKWLEVKIEKEGVFYEGFLQESAVFFLAPEDEVVTPTMTPTATPKPTGIIIVKPTELPETTPGVIKTPTPTITPRPTINIIGKPTATITPKPTINIIVRPKVSPTPTARPTPAVHALEDGDYPVNKPGVVTGHGSISEKRIVVVYVAPVYPYDLVCDENDLFITLNTKDTLILYDQYVDEYNNLYRHIGFEYKEKMYYGYISEEYIVSSDDNSGEVENNGTIGIGKDFEDYLDIQGFPESYKPFLRKLHEQYPNWIFEAYHTGLDWDDVIEQESIAGKNLITNNKSVEWKSLETGAYDWTTDKFIVYDGSTWVTASKEAVEYYMDPRNFLDETSIFMFEVLRYAAEYQDEEGVEAILKNTPFYEEYYDFIDEEGNDNSLSYAQTFIAAAEYSGVSPYHLATRVKQEVVTGPTTVSNSVTGTVSGLEGLYNFYNIGAYHSTVAGGAIANGLKYAKNGASNNDALNDASLIPWTNQYNAIVGGSYILGANYINRGQDTIYLQKFNVTDTSTYYHQYMANIEAPYAEAKKIASAYEGMEHLPIVFSIPIYEDMPKQAVEAPEKEYNPNHWLKNFEVLSTSGTKLQTTPTFNLKADQVYYLVVSNKTSKIQIKAEAVSAKATVIGKGFYNLEEGSNTIIVTVEAENGDLREYVLVVVRQE